MEELGSLWSFQESNDELRQKLLYTTIELESLKAEASEEMRKHKEYVKHLIGLLKIAYKERDEAKDLLQKLLNKLMPSNSAQLHPTVPQAQPESPLVIPMKANSSITESNSLSDTYNHQSHGSSPVDSFFDAVTSPDFSSMNMADSSHINFVNKTYVQEYTGSMSTGLVSASVPKIDPADAAIDSLINGKVLPQKGKLLQAVTEAGPLLQSLLVAGPLPRWRNPPPLQHFKIPPFSIKESETAIPINPKPAANSNSVAQKPMNSSSYPDMSRGSSQMCSASMLNFNSGASGSVLGSFWPLNSAKRQRFL
ncbi:hypothetical protein P3X46_000299 [Hevea brasiliensis]|uniref:Uncharacterized protein n=1 Tax=Hevea brasiliensis TaxID=3981 RepID=A0ABQ9NCI7_HEVBR|nr:uncharacterized protein LOC110636508 isoform X2 [Hevea brasiliensis]KAJ9188950.1 hypothetical protein P3X46_000299 [Hevea brasiliensis]